MTIVVGVDYSPLSELVVAAAVEQAQRAKQELHFLHVLPLLADSSAAEQEMHRTDLQKWLAPKLGALRATESGTRIVAHLAYGEPAEVLVQLASDLLAELVIVGTHGRTGMKRMLMGSVAEGVVRTCGCPVLVMRPLAHHEKVPKIEPPCPACVEARRKSGGEQLWCEQHSERHGRRHTYYNTRLDTWLNQRLIK